MRALITGVTGFAGSHLAELLLSKGIEVCGTVRPRSRLDNIVHILDRLTLVECDLTDGHAVDRAVQSQSYDRIYHLAAQSFVPFSWRNPEATIQTNLIGTVNLLDAVVRHSLMSNGIRVLIAGSSEEYGLVRPEETPITEENDLRPLSPYGVSKVAADLTGYQYYRSYGLHVIRMRAFNHTGPRRGEMFVTSTFARQVAEASLGKRKAIQHGNLDAVRDFTDVRDTVRAYYLAIEGGEPGEVYNVATGQGHKVSEVLDTLLEIAQIDLPREEDAARMRPSDVPLLIGDAAKLTEATGWKPQIPFRQTMRDLYEWWKERIQ